jgi:hypothetical protein
MRDISISEEASAKMVEHARATPREECCGLLAGRDGVIAQIFPAENAAERRSVAYEIAPKELFRLMRRHSIFWASTTRIRKTKTTPRHATSSAPIIRTLPISSCHRATMRRSQFAHLQFATATPPSLRSRWSNCVTEKRAQTSKAKLWRRQAAPRSSRNCRDKPEGANRTRAALGFQRHPERDGGDVVVLSGAARERFGAREKVFERFVGRFACAATPEFSHLIPPEILVSFVPQFVQSVGGKQYRVAGREPDRKPLVCRSRKRPGRHAAGAQRRIFALRDEHGIRQAGI